MDKLTNTLRWSHYLGQHTCSNAFLSSRRGDNPQEVYTYPDSWEKSTIRFLGNLGVEFQTVEENDEMMTMMMHTKRSKYNSWLPVKVALKAVFSVSETSSSVKIMYS